MVMRLVMPRHGGKICGDGGSGCGRKSSSRIRTGSTHELWVSGEFREKTRFVGHLSAVLRDRLTGLASGRLNALRTDEPTELLLARVSASVQPLGIGNGIAVSIEGCAE